MHRSAVDIHACHVVSETTSVAILAQDSFIKGLERCVLVWSKVVEGRPSPQSGVCES